MTRHFIQIAFCAVWLSLSGLARAEVIGNPDLFGNTDAPPIPVGWANVGGFGSASGVYVGNGWVLTANHIGLPSRPVPFYLDSGTAYTDGRAIRLTNPDGSPTDLQLVQLSPSAVLNSLPRLNIGSSPAVGNTIYSVGYGQTNVGGGGVANLGGSVYGFNEAPLGLPPGVKRWGSNETVAVDGLGNYDPASGSALANIFVNGANVDVESFFTRFYADLADYNAQTANGISESQLGGGDSGGAVFNAAGDLIGINDATGSQVDGAAAFGDTSAYAELATYRDQIVNDIPEPTCVALLAACSALGLMQRSRAIRCTRHPSAGVSAGKKRSE